MLKGREGRSGTLTALRCDSLEEVLRRLLVWPFERLDEDDAVVWMRLLGVDALDSERHLG